VIRKDLAVLAVLIILAPIVGDSRAAEGEPKSPHPPTQQPQLQYNEGGERITGTVVSTSSAGSYTYVQIDTGDGIVWAAAPRAAVEEGDMVLLPDGAPMPDFYSSSLDRRFEMIYFASSMQVHRDGDAGTMDLGEHCPPGANAADVDVSGIEPATGGLTIAEILERKLDLAGKDVSVRGKVVKCSPGILGRTWIHLRDGTLGPEGVADVTITTHDMAAVGDTLLVRGTVSLDKDLHRPLDSLAGLSASWCDP